MADPGFPVGGGVDPLGGESLTQALFGKNVCENERIGSRRGGGVHPARPLDPPMDYYKSIFKYFNISKNKFTENFIRFIQNVKSHNGKSEIMIKNQ